MDKPAVVAILKEHKRIIALRSELEYKYDGVLGAQVLTDMPRGTGTSDPIQTALNKIEAEIKQLDLEIKRVNNWLRYLTEEEQFYIEQCYFEQRYVNHIINKWQTKQGYYLGRSYWKKTHRVALKKICELTK